MAICAICVPIILFVPMVKEINHNNTQSKLIKLNHRVEEFQMV